MSLARIRDEFRVPSFPGARVTVDAFGKTGTIVGCHGDYIQVQVDGLDFPTYVHPDNLSFHTNKEKAA